MKVIKRDGRAVDYDKSKIETAIEKANQEVVSQNRASKEDIKGIITYIEELNKKRILVEDIQDIIEEILRGFIQRLGFVDQREDFRILAFIVSGGQLFG